MRFVPPLSLLLLRLTSSTRELCFLNLYLNLNSVRRVRPEMLTKFVFGRFRCLPLEPPPGMKKPLVSQPCKEYVLPFALRKKRRWKEEMWEYVRLTLPLRRRLQGEAMQWEHETQERCPQMQTCKTIQHLRLHFVSSLQNM